MRILIAEDQKEFIESLAEGLTYEGHDVLTAPNGQRALEIFSDNPGGVDLILADIQMPEMDGMELLKHIRKNDEDIPFVFMTAHGNLDIAIQALKLGAFDFVIKPFELEELYFILSKLESVQFSKAQLSELAPLTQEQIQISIQSQLHLITNVANYFHNHLKPYCELYQLDHYKITLCLREALVNAIVHGNWKVPSSLKEKSWKDYNELLKKREQESEFCVKEVNISYHFNSEQLGFEVKDQGAGFCYEQFTDQSQPKNILSYGGRGLLLIQSYMDEVTWNDAGNQIKMIKFLENT